jgi:hypothetical protein
MKVNSTFILLLGLGISSMATSEEAAEITEPFNWRFKVYLDDKPIGWHEFRVTEQGSLSQVETEASFDVKFFFITAYRYRHRNVELYDTKGLLSIDAYTNANGKEYRVRGERSAEYFLLKEGGRVEKLPSGLTAFCYWSPAILKESRLLNSQTGDYEPVDILDRGDAEVAYRGTVIPARKFDIMVKGLPISIWYAREDGRWLALESQTEGGNMLRYEPKLLPGTSPANHDHLAFIN